jgi:hypothetical protein
MGLMRRWVDGEDTVGRGQLRNCSGEREWIVREGRVRRAE